MIARVPGVAFVRGPHPAASPTGTRAPAAVPALLLGGVLILLAGCRGTPERSAAGSGNARMARRLVEITRGLDPAKNIFLNTKRAAALKAGIEKTPSQRMSLLPLLADELLKAGRTEEAIAIGQSLLHPDPHDAIEAPPAVQ